MKDLHVRPKALKTEKNTEETLHNIVPGNDFLVRAPAAQETKARIDNRWDFNKLKSSCTAKITINRIKSTYKVGDNVF
jgi:hypothetical protein